MHHAKQLEMLPTSTKLPVETVRVRVHRFLQIRGCPSSSVCNRYMQVSARDFRRICVDEIQHNDNKHYNR